MPKKRDERTGRYVKKATLDDVRAVFDTVAGPPVVTSADVADATELSRDSARRKLETLRDRGDAARRTTAGRVLYWPADHDGDETVTDGEVRGSAETTLDDSDPVERIPTSSTTTGATTETAPTDTDEDDTAADAISDVLDGWRPGQSPDRREQRREAGRAALRYLRRHEVRTAADFRRDVEPEAPVDGQSPDTWWRQSARPALKRAQEAGLVTFVDGRHEYRWVGDDIGRDTTGER
jgi:hypothetical protein